MAKDNKNLIQIIKFSIIGVLNTLIDFVIFYLLVKFLPFVPKEVAQLVATGIAMTNSYLLNRKVTFEASGKINTKEIFRFIVVNIVSSLTSIVFICIFYDVVHVENIANKILDIIGLPFVLGAAEGKLLAKIIATPFVLAVNFCGNKLWVFGKK